MGRNKPCPGRRQSPVARLAGTAFRLLGLGESQRRQASVPSVGGARLRVVRLAPGRALWWGFDCRQCRAAERA
eukprot:13235276-Alexandrium_andersonii.AAC.1